jgi:hypothetical protein
MSRTAAAAVRLRTITARPVGDPSGDSPGPLALGDVILRYGGVDERQDGSGTQRSAVTA